VAYVSDLRRLSEVSDVNTDWTETEIRVKAGRAMGILAVVVVMVATVVGCAPPQEKERAGAAGGEDPSQPAREAKASRTDMAIPPVPADGDYNCADFVTRAQAKIVLERVVSQVDYGYH
jgi:hypothetical protein